LQWVQDNIEAFGGDRTKITVFGLSAGGTFTSSHLMAYGGERGVPFAQAWVMSGPPGTALNISSDVTTTHTLAVAKRLDCGIENEDENDEAVLQCLRYAPMEKLLDVAMDYSVSNHPPAGLSTFTPSVDGDIFEDRQSALYRAGKFVKGIYRIAQSREVVTEAI
jgi:carboxylesterase type B